MRRAVNRHFVALHSHYCTEKKFAIIINGETILQMLKSRHFLRNY